MNVIGMGFRPYSQAEVDAEMDGYCRDQTTDVAAASAGANDDHLEPNQVEDESPVELSPAMRAVKDRMLAAIHRPRPPVFPVEARGSVATEVAGVVVVPSDASKDLTFAPHTPEAIEVSAPAEASSGTKWSKAGSVIDFSVFPVVDVLEVGQSDDPLREMTELCQQLLRHKDYARVREDYCNLSIRLNLMGKLAPAYRPELKSGADYGATIHHAINRDQIVIDLHWIHACHMPVNPLEPMHQALFSDKANFQFDLAWGIAHKKWTPEYRAVEALCLTTLQQCQMLRLRGPEVAACFDDLDAGWLKSGGKSASRLATVRRLIGQWAERDKRILSQRGYYEMLWLARELLGHDVPKQQIAVLHALMTGGEVQDRTTIRDRLKSLDRHVTGV